MKYYKHVDGNIIISICTGSNLAIQEISEEEYITIMNVVNTKPEDTEDTVYILYADPLRYEPHPRPAEEEPEATVEDYQEALAEMGVELNEEG